MPDGTRISSVTGGISMKKFAGSTAEIYGGALRLSAAIFCLAIYCGVTPNNTETVNAGNVRSTTERPGTRPACTYDPWTFGVNMPYSVQGPAATSDGTYAYVLGGFENATFH